MGIKLLSRYLALLYTVRTQEISVTFHVEWVYARGEREPKSDLGCSVVTDLSNSLTQISAQLY